MRRGILQRFTNVGYPRLLADHHKVEVRDFDFSQNKLSDMALQPILSVLESKLTSSIRPLRSLNLHGNRMTTVEALPGKCLVA